ncbi:MAG: glycosyltransferase family 4 protein, partial [Dolichospermum sp.]
VKKQVPNAKFLFLGTGVSLQKVLQDLNLPACDWINIIPQYNSEELPMLLSGATVGAFPSYIEGFGFAVLEKLASGLPTIAYDVPGPREILKLLDGSLLTPVGDVS